MTISVVIVSWNVKRLLLECLRSLEAESGGHELEVFVVDNASTDGGPAEVLRAFPEVRVIQNTKNVGFAAANNQGLRLAGGEFVLLLNPDTLMLSGSLLALVEFLQAHPQIGAVGPLVLNPDGSLQHSCSPFPALQREAARLFHLPGVRSDGYYSMEAWNQNLPRPIDVLLGACILFRRTALDQVGMMDEGFFMYSEEVDLCWRLAKAGWQSYWVPGARIIHYGGQSTQQVAGEMFLRLYEGKLKFFRKHQGRLAAQLYKLILWITAVTRLTLYPLAWALRPQGRLKNRQLAVNYRQLIASLPDL